MTALCFGLDFGGGTSSYVRLPMHVPVDVASLIANAQRRLGERFAIVAHRMGPTSARLNVWTVGADRDHEASLSTLSASATPDDVAKAFAPAVEIVTRWLAEGTS